MEAMNVSYLIENQTLQIAVADSEKNIRLLQYAPFSKSHCLLSHLGLEILEDTDTDTDNLTLSL